MTLACLFDDEPIGGVHPLATSVWPVGASDDAAGQSVHFSAVTDEWATPDDVFDALNAEFGFTLDACATDENARCAAYYTRGEDGLRQPWRGTVWINPPYGNEIRKWIAKAADCSERRGVTVVLLVPSRTDTAWFHDYVTRADEVRFIRGRLKFGDAIHSAPFPSMIVVFRGKPAAKVNKI